jgi:hypothetical protein
MVTDTSVNVFNHWVKGRKFNNTVLLLFKAALWWGRARYNLRTKVRAELSQSKGGNIRSHDEIPKESKRNANAFLGSINYSHKLIST